MARTISERSDAVLSLARVFRLHGFEGANLSVISAETGLGKGSLYNFFPGGKEEMARAVLTEVNDWFNTSVYAPLRQSGDAEMHISEMFEATTRYFESRELVCLFGAFALGQELERFATAIRNYFADWIAALESALTRAGHTERAAHGLATDTVAGIQGALIMSRALGQPEVFRESLGRLRDRLDPPTAAAETSLNETFHEPR